MADEVWSPELPDRAAGANGRSWIPRAELLARLRTGSADPGLRADLAVLAGETTDDLGPIR